MHFHICIIFIIYNSFGFGPKKNDERYKTFTITIPEDLNYTDIFDDIFKKYISKNDSKEDLQKSTEKEDATTFETERTVS